jgi:hypothetical protein
MPRRRLEQIAAAREVAGVKVLAHGEQLRLDHGPGHETGHQK